MTALKVPELKVSELGEYLKEQRQHAQLSLRQLAAQAGVSNPYLSQVERGLRKPSAEVLQQIAKGLRISAEALYVRAGILEERGDRIEVEAAILTDPFLSERQRRVLLDIYETFRTENDREAATEEGPETAAGSVLAGDTSSSTNAAAAGRTASKKSATKKSAAQKSATQKSATQRSASKKSAAQKSATLRSAADTSVSKRAAGRPAAKRAATGQGAQRQTGKTSTQQTEGDI